VQSWGMHVACHVWQTLPGSCKYPGTLISPNHSPRTDEGGFATHGQATLSDMCIGLRTVIPSHKDWCWCKAVCGVSEVRKTASHMSCRVSLMCSVASRWDRGRKRQGLQTVELEPTLLAISKQGNSTVTAMQYA
jgi:hypothetical protein